MRSPAGVLSALRRFSLVVLLAGMLVAMFASGIRQSFGLFLLPMTRAHGWGREAFAFAIALMNLNFGIIQPLAGMVADRWGSGRVLIVGGICYALGTFFMSRAETPLALALSAGLLVSVGLGASGFAIVFGAVSRTAPPQLRTLYMTIAAAGGSLGQFLLIPLGQSLITTEGWQSALVTMGSLALALPLLAVILMGRAERSTTVTGEAVSPVQALRRAGSERRYWLLFWGFFVCGFHVAFIINHLPAFLVDQGISPRMGALTLSLIGLFNIAGSLILGGLGGRYSKRKLLCGIYLGRAVVMALLMILPLSLVTLMGFAGVMGFLWLATVPLTGSLVGQMYGVRYLSTLYGVVFLGHQVGSFLGVWLGGWVFDHLGSYTPMWWLSMALGLLSAAIHWPIDERSPEELNASLTAPA
ncbi:MAG: MFS transporter [Deltaproteobacteria bacterium]|nr:MFS transporter [Deltaproteobacteria bacterium]